MPSPTTTAQDAPAGAAYACVLVRARAKAPVPTAGAPSPHERAQTLIEVLVVMLILGVLVATLAGVGRSSSDTTATQSAVSVARTYADAVEAFADDHGGRAPVPDSSDWPARLDPAATVDEVARDSTVQAYASGPRNVASAGRRYLRKIPDPVLSGAVILNVVAPVQPTAAAVREPVRTDQPARFTYRTTGTTDWRIDVETRRGAGERATWKVVCTLGTDPTRGVQKC